MYLKELELAKKEVKTARMIYELMKNPPRNPSMTYGGGHPPANRAPEDLAGPLTFLNPMQLFELPELYRYWMGEETSQQFFEFCKTIENHKFATFFHH